MLVMSNPYKVSILVPVYGVERFIERCAVSIFEQTYENIEYVFVDDCGPDNSIPKLKEVMARYPDRLPNIRIVRHERNRGLSAARNTAVDAATGEFILHVDSDDCLNSKEVVERVVEKQMEMDSDIVLFEHLILHSNYSFVERLRDYNSASELCVAALSGAERHCVCGGIIRKTLYTDNGIQCKEGYNMGEDLQVMPRLLYFAKRIEIIHEPWYVYDKTNEESYTYSFNERVEMSKEENISILSEFFHDKGGEYVDALKRYKLSMRIRQIMNVCKEGGHDEFYRFVRNDVNDTNKRFISELPFLQRLLIKLMWCRPLLNFLCRTTASMKHLYHRMKSR